MAIDQVIACLLRVPLFAGLKPLQITEIARRGQRCAFGDGETIIATGEPADGAYLIISGQAHCLTGYGRQAAAEPVEPGSLLGEPAMFVDHIYGVTVVAKGWVDCLKLERSALHAHMLEDPDIADKLAHVIRDRLARVAGELHEIDELLAAAAASSEAAMKMLPLPNLSAAPASAMAG